MSYNIDSTTVIKCDAWMYAKDVERILRKHADDLPECHFLDEMGKPDAEGKVKVDERFWWYGEFSGNAHSVLVKKIAPLIHGTVEVVFTWEGGDSHTGLRIRDGKVTEPKVVMTLADD